MSVIETLLTLAAFLGLLWLLRGPSPPVSQRRRHLVLSVSNDVTESEVIAVVESIGRNNPNKVRIVVEGPQESLSVFSERPCVALEGFSGEVLMRFSRHLLTKDDASTLKFLLQEAIDAQTTSTEEESVVEARRLREEQDRQLEQALIADREAQQARLKAEQERELRRRAADEAAAAAFKAAAAEKRLEEERQAFRVALAEEMAPFMKARLDAGCKVAVKAADKRTVLRFNDDDKLSDVLR